jgi:hypothetical protein
MPVGIDIAKSVFQIHYVDAATGEIVNKISSARCSWSTSRTETVA